MGFLHRLVHAISLRLLERKYFYNCNLCHADLIKYEVNSVVVFRCPNFLDEQGEIRMERDTSGKKRMHDFFEVAQQDLR